jgi:NADPH:quinone reductase-like Zn-dependent oxidoreductase
MKAIRLHQYGGELTLEDVSKPTIKDDEVLVKIKNTAVNHLDTVEASGVAKEIFPIELPWIPGHEFSGIIEEVGKKVTSLKIGDAVFGNAPKDGAYAEYIAVKKDLIVKKPENLSFAEAAGVAVAAQTAWQAIFTHGQLSKGQRILIHGGAGGVGAYAVQLAYDKGAEVIVTASDSDKGFLYSIGAKQVIDYKTEKFEDKIAGKVDVVFDLIGGENQQRSYTVLRPGGYLISASQPVSEKDASKYKVTALMMRLAPSAEKLSGIAKLLKEGKLKVDIAKVYPLENVSEAWKDISANLSKGKKASQKGTHGKLVLEVSN